MLFPLKVNYETYYAGMGEYEIRNVITTNDGKVIAKIDYLKASDIDELNQYVKSLEDKIKKLET